VNSLKTPNNEIPNPMIPEIQIYNTMLRWKKLIKFNDHLIFVNPQNHYVYLREKQMHITNKYIYLNWF
jgi:hypothetical protein